MQKWSAYYFYNKNGYDIDKKTCELSKKIKKEQLFDYDYILPKYKELTILPTLIKECSKEQEPSEEVNSK